MKVEMEESFAVDELLQRDFVSVRVSGQTRMYVAKVGNRLDGYEYEITQYSYLQSENTSHFMLDCIPSSERIIQHPRARIVIRIFHYIQH
jgi:hypothetical protein